MSRPLVRAALFTGVLVVAGLSGCTGGKADGSAMDLPGPSISGVSGATVISEVPAPADNGAVSAVGGGGLPVWRLSRSDGFHVNGMDDFTVTAVYFRPSADFEPSGLRSILNWDFSGVAASDADGRVSSAGGRFLFSLAASDGGMDALAVLDASIDFLSAGPERFSAFATSGTLMKLFVNGGLVLTVDRPSSGSPVLVESAGFELRPGSNTVRLLLALPAGLQEIGGRLLIAPKDGGSPWFLEKTGVKP